jgi:hypothetical protein
MSMKYIVVKRHDHREQLFIFPFEIEHQNFHDLIKKTYPDVQLVSAGSFGNFRDKCNVFPDNATVDQVSLHGESFTLGSRSRPEDTKLFQRLSNGYY